MARWLTGRLPRLPHRGLRRSTRHLTPTWLSRAGTLPRTVGLDRRCDHLARARDPLWRAARLRARSLEGSRRLGRGRARADSLGPAAAHERHRAGLSDRALHLSRSALRRAPDRLDGRRRDRDVVRLLAVPHRGGARRLHRCRSRTVGRREDARVLGRGSLRAGGGAERRPRRPRGHAAHLAAGIR